jgi:hypothetical protein
MLPLQRSCGIGYKGCGTSYAEKKQVELFFDEIEDKGHPSTSAQKSKPVQHCIDPDFTQLQDRSTGFFYTPLSWAKTKAIFDALEGSLSKAKGDDEQGATQAALIVKPKLVDVDGEAEEEMTFDWNELGKTVWVMCTENASDINWRLQGALLRRWPLKG